MFKWRSLPPFFALLSVVSSSSVPTCVLASFQWAFNSHHESPCSIASSLLGVCSGGSYDIQSLPAGSHYLGPTIDGANPCQCSTVSYSMMSACAACQNGTITAWTEWTTNCAKVSISSFPESIPDGLSVPGWAYLDVKSSNAFDPVIAKQNANLTESTAIPTPTSSTSSTTMITQTTSSAQASSSTTSAGVDSRANAIGSGVVGGLVGLAAILAVVIYLCYRRRRKISSIEAPEPRNNPPASPSMEQKEVPALVVHPPSVPYYQNQEAASSGTYSNSTISESERSLVISNHSQV